MDIKTIAIGVIVSAIGVIIGLVLLPVLAGFIDDAKKNTDVTNISGLISVLDLIAYGFTFGLVGLGVGMIAFGFKQTGGN